MGRAWVAPFSFSGEGPLHDVEIVASFWTGNRALYVAARRPDHAGGASRSSTGARSAATSGTTTSTYQLRQLGRLNSFAAELLNAPVAHKYGVRGELVWRHSPLAEEAINAPDPGAPQTGVTAADLRGTSFYGEVFVWLLGDDRIIGDQQGLEPFARYGKFWSGDCARG